MITVIMRERITVSIRERRAGETTTVDRSGRKKERRKGRRKDARLQPTQNDFLVRSLSSRFSFLPPFLPFCRSLKSRHCYSTMSNANTNYITTTQFIMLIIKSKSNFQCLSEGFQQINYETFGIRRKLSSPTLILLSLVRFGIFN